MVKMKIHSKSKDPQISRLNEFFLVANRIWKAGRGMRQSFGKFKCNNLNPNGGGGAELPLRQATKTRLLPTDPLIRQCKAPTKLFLRQASPSWEAHSVRKGKTQAKHRPGEMPTPRQGRVSELSKERWRIAQRSPSTVISTDRPLGHFDANHNERGRGV